jgi:hypothetical protein
MNKAVLISNDVHKRLRDYCQQNGKKIKFVTEAAIIEYVQTKEAKQ